MGPHIQHAAQFCREQSSKAIEDHFKIIDKRIEQEYNVKDELAKKMALNGLKKGLLSAA